MTKSQQMHGLRLASGQIARAIRTLAAPGADQLPAQRPPYSASLAAVTDGVTRMRRIDRNAAAAAIIGLASVTLGVTVQSDFNLGAGMTAGSTIALLALATTAYLTCRVTNILSRLVDRLDAQAASAALPIGAGPGLEIPFQPISATPFQIAADDHLVLPTHVAVDGDHSEDARLLAAIDAGRLRHAMRPVVTLPHRRLRILDSKLELHDEQGILLDSSRCSDAVSVMLTRLRLAHAIATLRSPENQARELAILFPLSTASLADEAFVAELLGLIEAEPQWRERLLLDVPLEALAIEDNRFRDAINRLCGATLRLVGTVGAGGLLADVVNNRIGWPILSHIRLPANSLIGCDAAHLSVLRALDIALVATDVLGDAQVVELIDLDIEFAQGPLFTPAAKAAPAPTAPAAPAPTPAQAAPAAAAPRKSRARRTTTPRSRKAAAPKATAEKKA